MDPYGQSDERGVVIFGIGPILGHLGETGPKATTKPKKHDHTQNMKSTHALLGLPPPKRLTCSADQQVYNINITSTLSVYTILGPADISVTHGKVFTIKGVADGASVSVIDGVLTIPPEVLECTLKVTIPPSFLALTIQEGMVILRDVVATDLAVVVDGNMHIYGCTVNSISVRGGGLVAREVRCDTLYGHSIRGAVIDSTSHIRTIAISGRGDVTVDATGINLWVSTQGTIKFGGTMDGCALMSTDGDIAFTGVAADAKLETGDGRIMVSGTSMRPIHAKTESGSLRGKSTAVVRFDTISGVDRYIKIQG